MKLKKIGYLVQHIESGAYKSVGMNHIYGKDVVLQWEGSPTIYPNAKAAKETIKATIERNVAMGSGVRYPRKAFRTVPVFVKSS